MNKKISEIGIAKDFQNIILRDPKLAKAFFLKWGIEPKKIAKTILNTNTHGGLKSKLKSLNNLKIKNTCSVIDIGPETGIETFVFARIFPKLYVFDPDVDNLKLIRNIIKKDKKSRKCSIKYLPAGFDNKNTSQKEMDIYTKVVKVLGHSNLTYYNVSAKKEIKEINVKADLIYIHKILSTISRMSPNKKNKIFIDSLKILKRKVDKKGVISWTEPDFAWKGVDLRKISVKKNKYSIPGCKDSFTQIIYENT